MDHSVVCYVPTVMNEKAVTMSLVYVRMDVLQDGRETNVILVTALFSLKLCSLKGSAYKRLE